MIRTLPTLLATLMLVGFLGAQTIAYIPDNNPALGGGNNFPFSIGAYTTIHCYYASQLRAQGVCGGAVLTDFAIAAATGSALYTLPVGQIQVGHLVVSPPIYGTWLSAMSSPTIVWDTAVSGPISFSATANTWVSLPGFATAGFVWDGVSDICVYITSDVGFTGGFQVRSTSTNVRYGTPTFMATTQNPTTAFLLAMKARFTFLGGLPQYQVNQPNSSFNIDGVVGQACSAAVVTKCNGSAGTLNFATALFNPPYELAVDFAGAIVPVGGGGFTLPASGQHVNINLGSIGFVFLNGLAFPPHPGMFSLPFVASAPLLASAQQVVLDPSSPDGLALSAPASLNAILGGSLAGPILDNASLQVNLGVPPLCGPSVFSYYGINYSQIFVSTNGRVTFGVGNTATAPTTVSSASANPPSINVWADYNQGMGGNIVVSAPTATTVRIDWTAIPYHLQPGTANTFSIVLDAATNTILLDGLAGLAVHPTAALSLVGLSRGTGSTNPGLTAFIPSTTGTTANGNDMIVSFGAAGTLTTGLTGILFMPNMLMNYDWVSF